MASAHHVDSAQLADIAVGATVAPEVTEHVAGCAQCTSDLAVLWSLLEADGPAGQPLRPGAPPDDLPEPIDAMADTADGPPIPDESAVDVPVVAAGRPRHAKAGSHQTRNAVIGALVIACVLILLAVLLWR